MVNKSPKDRVIPLNGHSWHINGGDPKHLLAGMILQVACKPLENSTARNPKITPLNLKPEIHVPQSPSFLGIYNPNDPCVERFDPILTHKTEGQPPEKRISWVLGL